MARATFNLVPPYAAKVYRDSDQSVQSLTLTPLSFNQVRRDDGGLWTPSFPTRLTAPVDGWYSLHACAYLNVTSSYRVAYIRRNGQYIVGSTMHGANVSDQDLTISCLSYMVADDYVEVLVLHYYAGNGIVRYYPEYSPDFSMIEVT